MKTYNSILIVLFLTGASYGFSQCLSGGCYVGKGILLENGERYIGTFQQGTRHGLGTCFYPDGSRYFGFWQDNQPHGEGIKSWADGRTLKGLWNRGKLEREDPQLVIAVDGRSREIELGCISGNCTNGQGIYLSPDGAIYSGDFAGGKKHGIGIYYYPSQAVYKGKWIEDLPEGRGTMILSSGEQQSGLWQKGRLVSNEPPETSTKSAPADLKEEACLTGNCQDGQGTYLFEDGSKYTGSFRAGKPNGKGIIYYQNGDRYEGQLKDGYLHGVGAFFYPDGRIIRGIWEKGVYKQSLEAVAETGPATPELPELKIWAVVIGIAAYSHMPALRFTDDDAYRFYAFLKSPEGGALPDEQIQILIDESASRDNILRAMQQIFGKAGPNDLIILYFSGHGIPGAFLPIDFDGVRKKLLHYEISSILASSKAKYKLCLADACHSGGLYAMRSPEYQNSLITYYQHIAQSDPTTALIMSSKSTETSVEASGLRHGVFSHFLIRGLQGSADADQDKMVTVQELYQYVFQKVREYTGNQQSPVIRGSYDPKMPVAQIRD